MNFEPLVVRSQDPRLAKEAGACVLLLFLGLACVGPALDAEANGILALLGVFQTLVTYRGATLARELTATDERLVLGEKRLHFRHFGDDYVESFPLKRVTRFEAAPDEKRLLVEVSPHADDHPEGLSVSLYLGYSDARVPELVRAFDRLTGS